MDIILLTLATQIGSAVFNSFRSSQQANEIADKQRELEQKITLDGIENSREEYAELCALQREIETRMHRDRLAVLYHNHKQNMIQNAYSVALGNWPLLIPPYIIKKDNIFENNMISEMSALPLNCILTTSSNRKFNTKIFPKLEENIATFCSRYWNMSNDKSVRFYQNSWRHPGTDVGSRIYDLYAHLSDIPTLVISPIISDGSVLFKFYWWGISQNPADVYINNSSNIYNPQIDIKVTEDFEYSKEQVESLVNQLSVKLSAFISYFADLYYWNCYYVPPTLPNLLKDNILQLESSTIKDYAESYTSVLKANMMPGHLSDTISFIDTLSCLTGPEEFQNLVKKNIIKATETSIITVPEIRSLIAFNKTYNLPAINDKLQMLCSEEVEEVEQVELACLDDSHIRDFVNKESLQALNPICFAYINWNKSVIIGTFCNQEGDPTLFAESNTTRIFVLTDSHPSFEEEISEEVVVNIINLNKQFDMESNRTKKFRVRLGERFCELGEILQRESTPTKNPTSPWDGPNERKQPQVDELEVITNFFIKGVEDSTIPYTYAGNDMEIEKVLNWLDSLSDSAIGQTNQVYLIKTQHKEQHKLLYCAFLAKDDKFDLKLSPKHCYICESETMEMKDLFAGKRVYVIPFEN